MTLTGLDDWIDWFEQIGFHPATRPENLWSFQAHETLAFLRRGSVTAEICGCDGAPQQIVLRHDQHNPEYHSVVFGRLEDIPSDIAAVDRDPSVWDLLFSNN